jgi:glutathione-specific gamma-glutamylcyclotransferase
MATATRQMALTPELVARACRSVEDSGPSPGAEYLTDHDYDVAVRDTLTQVPPEGLWLFAYGSLLWKPAFEFVESHAAVAQGWHRSFCIRIARFRATPDRPGLMMALDRGGQCRGVIFRIPLEQSEETLHRLFRRELVVRNPPNMARWLKVQTRNGRLTALGFVANQQSRFYSGKLPLHQVADVLSHAAGHWGSCAEYLRETVAHLEERGIRDANLWRLQGLVAERLKAVRD